MMEFIRDVALIAWFLSGPIALAWCLELSNKLYRMHRLVDILIEKDEAIYKMLSKIAGRQEEGEEWKGSEP